MTKRKYLALVLLLCAVGGSVVFAAIEMGRSAAWPFKSVTPAELAPVGLTLTTANPSAQPSISAADAAAVAHRFQGNRVLEEHLMRCVQPNVGPRKLDRNCWAVSLTGIGIRYDVVLVDAQNGKVIEGIPGYN